MFGQATAFATGVLPDIYAFHRYTWNSVALSNTQARQFQRQSTTLSVGISPLTCQAACAPFTPSNSEQHLPPSYYRGCWHEVSRGFLKRYRQADQSAVLPSQQEFTFRKTSSSTRRCCVRLSPIAQNSLLLPPVGVWAVSQSQCGRSPSQVGYPSLPWWAVTPPTS